MEPFKVHVLGCGSAKPTLRHHASAQAVEMRGRVFLMDCSEGTQVLLRRSHVRFSKLQAVFISHIHGDHCLGLIGLICSFGLAGRKQPLHVYAPGDLKPVFECMMEAWGQAIDYDVLFHVVDTTKAAVVYEDKAVVISTLPLEHRVPCCGYLFSEKPTLPHIKRDMVDFYKIPFSRINDIKNGADWVDEDGNCVPNERLVEKALPPRKYAYCSDTKYLPNLHELIDGVDLLYHESTYTEPYRLLAEKYAHSTAAQAAQVAKDAHAKRLMLGHYSARYKDESPLLAEAQTIFPNTVLADEGLVLEV